MKATRQVGYVALMLILGFISSSRAATGYAGGHPWQVGDIIVCFGGGMCNAIRVLGNTATLLDQFSNGLSGDSRAVWMNNTLHAVAVDNSGGNQSNVVVYTIASVVPFSGTPVGHTALSIFPANGPAASGNNAQAVLVNGAGHIFVGNAGGGGSPGVSIVELNPNGSLAGDVSHGGAMSSNPLPVSCADIAGERLSMDLSKDGSAMYLTTSNPTYQNAATNGGNIQKVTLSSGVCTPFAKFGPGVALNGIQNIPVGAISSCHGPVCPPNELILVLAAGYYDIDGDPNGEPPIADQADDANICDGQVGTSLVSCALLLSTGGPGLTASPWIAGSSYSTGTTVLDANLHVQQVATAGTSGSSHPGWSGTVGATVADNQVTWTDLGVVTCNGVCPPWTPNTAYAFGAQITDSIGHIQQVTIAGTSGPGPGQPAGGWNDNGGATLDGLTWTDLGTSVVTKYAIANGVHTLQSLSLDPLVTDCTGSICNLMIPGPTVSNFWAGDSATANIYKVNFGNGSVTAIDINGNRSTVCSSCTIATNVEGFRIYGAEGSYQAGLTKVFSDSLTPGNSFTAVGNYPPPVSGFNSNDTNTWTLTEYSLTPNGTPPTLPITLYASLISQASAAGNNSGATDPGALRINNTAFPNPVPCFASTTDSTKCIIWKADTQVLSGNYLAETIFAPNNIINSGTDLFIDLHYDVTTAPGISDTLTGGTSKGSVHSLHEVPAQFTNGGANASGCTYSSPVESACYKTNRSTLNFTFQCSGLNPTTFANLQLSPGPPDLSLVKTFPNLSPKPAPQTVVLNGTNGKAPYRYSTSGPTGPNYTFQWNLNQAAVAGQIDLTKTDHLTGCTFDPTGTVQTFCVDFVTDPTCKNLP
jgi:hypothetical protein